MAKIKVLDLYSGMGGLSLGFSLALKDVEILGLDIDKYAVETYNFNLRKYNCHAKIQDVLAWKPKGKYDIIIGGPPCQPFSLANTKKVGKEHPLYPTFPRFFDVVLELKPKAFLLENVKGLITKRHRPLLEDQLKRMKPHYKIKYKVLNASFYGVPQRRERLFIFGLRKDLRINPSFPAPTHAEEETFTLTGKLHKWVSVREAIGDLLTLPPQNIIPYEQVEKIRRERDDTTRHYGKMEFPDNLDLPSRTISSHTIEGTKRETIVIPITEHVMTEKGGWDNPKSNWGSRVIPEDKPSYTITGKHRCGQLVKLPSTTWLKKHPPIKLDIPSNAITSNTGKNKKWVHNSIIDHSGFRRLTVRECLRLQSFPDWVSFPSHISISRKYKLVGEAVCPALAYRLAIHIGKIIGWEVKEPPKQDVWQLPYFYRMFADYFA